MTDPQRLLAEFIEADRRDPGVDPRPFLDRAAGADRLELRALIEAYLERAPRRAWDPGAYRGSLAERAVDAATAELSAGWSAALPRLRHDAELKRSTVVERLAAAIGFPAARERVAAYYHGMEQGRLDPGGVSDRVLEALASILGTSAAALRASGAQGPPAPGAGGEVFARAGQPSEIGGTDGPEAIAFADDLAGSDELDRLFTGGDG